jgi:hypothetical protein
MYYFKIILNVIIIIFATISSMPYINNFLIYRKINRNGQMVMAEIIEKNVKRFRTPNSNYDEYEYYYKVSYDVDGELYQQWLSASLSYNYYVGSMIRVYYNKECPEECMVLDETQDRIVPYRFIFSLLCIVICILAIIQDSDS